MWFAVCRQTAAQEFAADLTRIKRVLESLVRKMIYLMSTVIYRAHTFLTRETVDVVCMSAFDRLSTHVELFDNESERTCSASMVIRSKWH